MEFPNFTILRPMLLQRYDLDLLYEIYVYSKQTGCANLDKCLETLRLHEKEYVESQFMKNKKL